MPTAHHDGVELAYDTFGDPDHPTLLLVMGLTAQMTAWDEEWCRRLAERGFHVVRFDNRDAGLSSTSQGPPPDLAPLLAARDAGVAPGTTVPYTLADMAADAVAVLDAVGVESAHVVGASMGGMVVQQLAIDHPERVRSLTSIMSTTGDPRVGQSRPAALAALLTPPPSDRALVIEQSVRTSRLISGPLFDEDRARRRATAAHDRSFHPRGGAFQMAAILAGGDRTEALRGLSVPALVIHGAVDPLIQPSGGEATAAAIPGAELLVVEDMGHDLPEARWDELTDAITDLAARADAA